MKAVGFAGYGGPEQLELLELPSPVPGAGQVLVRVSASTVNPADLQFLRGDHDAFVAGAQRPLRGGLEFAGTVVDVGPGLSVRGELTVGAQVVGTSHFIPSGRGCHAEYVAASAAAVVVAPEGMSPVEAATVPMNGLTAQVVVDSLPDAGPVVVSGAAGAVGSYVTEMAAARGIEVLAVSAESDEAWLRARGAAWFVARGADAVAQIREILPGGARAAVDAAKLGTPLLEAVADDGVFLALRPGHVPDATRGIRPTLVSFRRYQDRPEVLGAVVNAAARGDLTTRVAAVFSPQEARAAFAAASARGLRGRVVIDWSGGMDGDGSPAPCA